MKTSHEKKAKNAVREAAAYLRSCGIHLPRFKLTAHWDSRIGGSWVLRSGRSYQLNMGRYPTNFLRNWFAVHELAHLLWSHHQPLRRKGFRAVFGEAPPPDYDSIHERESWKTTATWRFSWLPGPARPTGEPSWYGARAGGEERFCELLGLMWANGDFSMEPPADLADLWGCCWEHGLSRMV